MLISKKNRREVYKYLFKGTVDDISAVYGVLCSLAARFLCCPSLSRSTANFRQWASLFATELLDDKHFSRCCE